MNKKKLLIVMDSMNVGGIEKRLIDLITNLDKSKYKCTVCTFYGGKLIQEYQNNNIKVIFFNPEKRKGILGIIKFIRFSKFLKSNKFDIALMFFPRSIVYGTMITKLRKIPLIISFRENSRLKIYQKKIQLSFLKFSNLFVNKVIAVSENTRRFTIKYVKLNPKKIIAIPNGIDLKRFNKKINIKKIKKEFNLDKEKIITIIARLNPQKNHKNFLKAASIIAKSIPNTKFLIVGDGKLRKKLENYSNFLGISKKIIFTGIRKDIPEILKISDIFILSSDYEGLPITILEAMASSKPIVATNVSGNPEAVVHNKTGILVPPKNSEALAKAVIKLLKNKKLRKQMGKQGRRRVEKYFTIEKMIKEYEKVFDSLIK